MIERLDNKKSDNKKNMDKRVDNNFDIKTYNLRVYQL